VAGRALKEAAAAYSGLEEAQKRIPAPEFARPTSGRRADRTDYDRV